MDLSDANVVGLSLDMGAWPGAGTYTETSYALRSPAARSAVRCVALLYATRKSQPDGLSGNPATVQDSSAAIKRGLNRVFDRLEVLYPNPARKRRNKPAVLVPEEVFNELGCAQGV